MKITAAPPQGDPQSQQSTFLPEELPDFPDSGLEGDVSDQNLGSFLLLGSLFLPG